ncbi:unnamed protein product [Parascedosporium putredinis]|uniref:DUF4045 domain-containing protein n=1 Tax=Parascedosporium putredinis TaxID=1442378 RepID=A0A9P1H8K1_9PEZI|nr:unnamed protein product [Parascedosporium putredinis]CAI8000850.1 unnamed protein product [Parascedosporium putredinis]
MSDDVSQFLQQVQQLQGRRAEEDEARSRELEEKFFKKRVSALLDELSAPDDTFDNMESPVTNFSMSPTKETESFSDAESKRTSITSSATTLPSPGMRAAPMSWQRRPNSQSFDKAKSRPLSMVAAENAARTSTTASPEPSSASEQTYTRDQISQALSSKDPTWFRQTSERGLNSPAFRRSQVEDEERLDMSSMRSQLPGMTASDTRESPISNPHPYNRIKSSRHSI